MAKYLETIGRKRIMLIGCVMQAIGCVLQAIIVYLPRDAYYSLLGIVYTARTL